MAEPAPARSNASNTNMGGAQIATGFWDAVQACLVRFHQIPSNEAAQKVTELWVRLAQVAFRPNAEMPPLDDMIYHEEPWYIACNLVNSDKPLAPHRIAYEQILQQNRLAKNTTV
jgi:hypothetical protein